MAIKHISGITLAGLLIAFFAAPLIITAFALPDSGPLSDSAVVLRELTLIAVAALLIFLIIMGERRSLGSIGLHGRHWGKSFLLSLLMLLVCAAVLIGCLALLQATGIPFGEGSEARRYESLSLWTMTLIVIRAGFVEELFYRGYIMSRLEEISGQWLVYFLMPAVIFGLLHFRQGWGGILISFAVGLVFAWFFWKKRDLKANIFAHFLVDFIPNVILPLFG